MDAVAGEQWPEQLRDERRVGLEQIRIDERDEVTGGGRDGPPQHLALAGHRGEARDRVHRTRLETETITTTEVERTVETENELETTDRFEMRRESEIALMEETSTLR